MRHQKHMETAPIDTEFLNALDHMKDKSYAGIGLGVDRLAMIFANATNIHEVEPLVVQ
jgi:elongation factor P--beta-lysine ligase